MAKFSLGMKHLSTARHEQVVSTSKKVIWLFGGTMPTKAQIEALIQTSGVIQSNSLKALGTLRLSAAYPNTATVQIINKNFKKWSLEALAQDYTLHSSGALNWFVFMYVDSAINNPTYTTNANVFQAFVGSVGDIGSGSDLEVLSALSESGKVYKITDLEIRVP